MHGRIQGSGPLPLPEKSQNIRFPCNSGPDPLKNHKATKPAFIGPPAKRHLNGVSLAGRWWPIYSGIWILYPLIIFFKKKNVIKFGLPLTKFLDPRMTWIFEVEYWVCYDYPLLWKMKFLRRNMCVYQSKHGIVLYFYTAWASKINIFISHA